MSKGSNSQTTQSGSSVSPNPVVLQDYYDLLNRAQNVSNTPYTPFSGQEVAPINAQQTQGVGNINTAASGFSPYSGQAGAMIDAAGQPISASDISQFESPYTQQVVNATQADFDTQNARAKSVTDSGAASQGALGGNRVGVAEALTQEGQQRVQAPVIAGLENTGFQTALTAAQQQKQQQQSAGTALNTAGLSAAQTQFGAGTAEQQTSQAQDTQQMTDYYTAQGYPFATAQWLAGITLGTGSQMGQTSTGTATTQGPTPNTFGQAAGLGISALSLFSDKRLKENIREIGKLNDGQKIYRYNFKGDKTTRVGLISQEVEKHHPHAVTKVAGVGMVDYDTATEDAIKKWSGGSISGFADGGTPFGPGTQGWVPTIGKIGGATLHDPGVQQPKMAEQKQPDYSGMGKNLGTIGKNISNWWDSPMTQSTPATWGGFDSTENAGAGLSADAENPSPFARGGIVRRGFEDGGVPSFDDRFSGDDVPVSSGFMGALEPSFNKRFGAGVPITLPKSKGFEPVAPDSSTDAPPPTGVEPSPDVPLPTPRPPVGVEPEQPDTPYDKPTNGYADKMDRIAAAHRKIESGNNYFEVGKPNPKDGDRPYGAYQVMGKNIPTWTEQYLGQRMSPTDFLKNPEAQDAVYKARMGEYIDKYGLTGAVDHWLGMGKQDYLGTTHPEYQSKFAAALNGASGGDSGGNPDVTPVSFRPGVGGGSDLSARSIPRGQPPFIPGSGVAPQETRANMGGFNPLGLSDEARQGLISMGLGMMANRRGGPGSFLASMGEGGEQGMTTYASARAATAGQEALARKEAFDREKLALPYSGVLTTKERMDMSAKAATLEEQRRQHDLALRTPVKYYQDEDGVQHYALPRATKDGTVEFWPIDKNGQVGSSPLGGSLKEGAVRAFGESQPQGTPQVEGFPKTQPTGGFTQASLQDGIILANNKLLQSGPFDYRKTAPIIEKGMDVPDPQEASGRSAQALKTDAELWLQTGKLPPISRGNSPVAIAQQNYRNAVQNYGASLAQSRGLDPKETAEMWRTAPGMLRFVLGPDGRSTVSLGTAVRHLDTMRELAKAWDANDVQAINRIRAVVSREFGESAATNLNVAGGIVGPEIIKAIGVAGAGTEKDREAAAKAFSTASSPKQLMDAVAVTQKLLGGQLEGRKRQAANAGVSEDRFKSLIGDRPYEILTHQDKGGGSTEEKPTPTQKDRDYVKAHPEVKDKFVKRFGVEP